MHQARLALGAVGSVAVTALAAALAIPAAAAAAPASGAHAQSYSQHPTRRLCSAPRPGYLACDAIVRTDYSRAAIAPDTTPAGYGPTDLQSAYQLPSASAGGGQTVAIVDAYDDPNAESDLATYRSQYGLPACTTVNGCFKKVNQSGVQGSYPPADSGWAGEISLDVDMVSAACPNCHILLVEATSPTTANLGTGVNTAVNLGAKYVSNSYGGSESSADPSYDTSYYNHPGVAVTASSGDNGYGVEYPAASRYVTAVGGTSLSTASNSRGWTESAWSGAGSGCSAADAKPSWQTDSGCSRRTVADVSAVADPNTGVAVYQTYGGSGWQVYGGTSVASPIIASVYALAGPPASGTTPASYPYAHPSSLYDVTSGSNGSCSPTYLCHGVTGYDGPTGLGTPDGTAAFTGGGGGGTGSPTVTNPGNQSSTVGQPVSLQIQASDPNGQSLTYSATGLPPGLSINAASGLISGTPTTAGSYSVTVTATDTGGKSGSASFTWTVSGSGGGGCTASQLLGNPGFETGSSAPWSTTPGVIQNSSAGEPAHSGSYLAWLDGYGTTHTDTLSQSVTIPANCTTATLSYYLHIDTAESPGGAAYDTLKVQIISGGTTSTRATYSNLNAASGYQSHSLSLSSYVGKTITVKFLGHEDSSLQTSFVIDDTALNVS